jgi:hypothetical protein
LRLSDAQIREFVARGAIAQADVTAIASNKKKREHPEDDIQRACCQFWELCYPTTWHMTFHPPNGLAAKNKKLAGIFKGLGVKPGVFDLICVARRGPFSGFALELKAPGRVTTTGQDEWRARFIAEGWFTAVADSVDKALQIIRDYNELPPRRDTR